MATAQVEAPMDINFALFNYHVNNAKTKAKKAFIQRFGQEKWDTVMKPYVKNGIMGIFNDKPTDETKFYVDAVFIFVNQKAATVHAEHS